MNHSNPLQRYVYFLSPYLIKSTFSSFYGYVQRKIRYNDIYHQTLKELRDNQYKDNSILLELLISKTLDFINLNLDNNAFYRRYQAAHIKSSKDITKLPLISKEIVRKNLSDLYTLAYNKKSHLMSHTSGTTGSSIVFPISLSCFQREYAFRGMHYEWAGVKLHGREPLCYISGHPVTAPSRTTPPFWVKDFANNWLLLSSYHLNEDNLKYYIKKINEFKPRLIHGYPSSLVVIANANKKYGNGNPQLSAIFSASETLTAYQRNIIENSFQCKVFNWYGNSEMVANIVECEKGEMHLKYEHSYVEVLNDKNEHCKPGETGRLVCTGIANDLFPLIRYDIGDLVRVSKNQNSKCGKSGLLIDEVMGRVEDYIVTQDGKLIGRLDHIFKDSLGVIEAQIEQWQPNEIVINLVRGASYSKSDEVKILYESKVRFGREMKVKFNYVNDIQRTSNGKYRFVISHLKNRSI